MAEQFEQAEQQVGRGRSRGKNRGGGLLKKSREYKTQGITSETQKDSKNDASRKKVASCE